MIKENYFTSLTFSFLIYDGNNKLSEIGMWSTKHSAEHKAPLTHLSRLPLEIFTTHTAVTQNTLRTEAQTHLPVSLWLVSAN